MPYLLEPVVEHLVTLFGSYDDPNTESALSELILINLQPHCT